MNHPPMQMPCHVEQFTHSFRFRLLMGLLLLSGILSGLRLCQRLMWLLLDFQPLGTWVEASFLFFREGAVFLSQTLVMLTAFAALKLLVGRGGGRLLYRVEHLRATLSLWKAVLYLAVTGVLIWLCVRYRMSITTLGVLGAVGAVFLLVQLFARCFHRNVSRILADVNMSNRRGSFLLGGGVQCLLQLQSMVLLVASALPVVFVMMQGAVVMWLVNFLSPILGASLTDQMRSALLGGGTSVFSMYGVELLQSLLQMAELALVITLYGVYEQAHEFKRSRSC